MSAIELDEIEDGALSDGHIEYLSSRGISQATAEKLGISGVDEHYFASIGKRYPALTFPYFLDGKENAVKLRAAIHGKGRRGFACAGSPQSLWNIQNIVPGEPLYITEGEPDAASLVEIGINNAGSIPNGAVERVRDGAVDPRDDKKFAWVWNAHELLDACPKIIIATDSDKPGRATAEEIARRVGKDKCWRVTYPEGCKDANDVLVTLGRDKLKEIIDAAEPWPVAGLYDVSHFRSKVSDIYRRGIGKGQSTGYEVVDEIYTVVPGQLTTVTGIPGSGKSEFVDQLMLNLAEQFDWRFAVCSFENSPDLHIAKLMAKRVRKSFFKEEGVERMDDAERDDAEVWLQEHFLFLHQDDGALSDIDSILSRLRTAVMRFGIRGAVIDPYNYVSKPYTTSETDWVSDMLSKVGSFAKSHGVHVWFIAHPTKLQRNAEGGYVPPRGYEISGSANWFNKTDMGITVHRPNPEESLAQIINWKTRFSWVGKTGSCFLNYNKSNFRYEEGSEIQSRYESVEEL